MTTRQSSRALRAEPLERRHLLSAGYLDISFNDSGQTIIEPPGMVITADDTVVRSDRKIIVAGTAFNQVPSSTSNDFVVGRYNSNGTADKTFGTRGDGLVILPSNSVSTSVVALQSDNKIVVADIGGPKDSQFMIVRYTVDGKLDSTFGKGGIALIPVSGTTNDVAHDIVIQKDGKIVVAGQARSGSVNNNEDGAVVRLNTNGTLDTSFGDHGKTLIGLGDDEQAEAVTLDYAGNTSNNPDYGKIVIAGKTVDGSTTQFFIARLQTNGKIDTSFHHTGKFASAFVSEYKYSDARSIVVQASNKIVIAGLVGSSATGSHKVGVIRLNPDGSGDNSFGPSNGQIEVGFSGGSARSASMVINQTGELLVGGAEISTNDFFLLTSNGQLDKAFGPNGTGKATSGRVISTTDAEAIALSPGGTFGTFVAAGGKDFLTNRFYDRASTTVSIAAIQPDAFEAGKVPATFNVVLAKNAPVTTRIFYTIEGTATSPFGLLRTQIDYSGVTAAPPPPISTGGGSGIISHLNSGIVDIKAGTGFLPLFITPNDDARVESDETIIFILAPDPSYDINPLSPAATAVIHDNDSTAVTKTFTATADAYVKDGSDAAKNFGTATQLQIKQGSSGFNRQAYLKFDLSSLSSASSVKLNLFGELSNSNATNIATQLFAVVDTSWSESGINFNNKPTAGSSVLASATVLDATPRMYTFDVTAYVKVQLAAGHKTVSFVLKNPSGGSPYTIFNSREASSNKPTLSIT